MSKKQETNFEKLFQVHYAQIYKSTKPNQSFEYIEFLKQYLWSCMKAIHKILIEDKYEEYFKEICNFFNEQLNKDHTQQTNNHQSGQIEVEQQEEQNQQINKANNPSTFQSINNNNQHYSLYQQKIQIQTQNQIQAQQEIQYYVYEDLNNLMEVLADVKQTLIHFKN